MSGKTGKSPVRNLKRTVLSEDWAVLSKYAFDYRRRDGEWEHQDREIYHRGDAAAVLPFDPRRGTVLLVRQFRLPGYLKDGLDSMLEVCAGVLDEYDAEACVRREAFEELGYRLHGVTPAFKAYSSPGSVTERVFCFTATYGESDRVSEGGGRADEGEDIEILELPLDEALGLIPAGGITDAKTIALIQHLKLSLA